MSEPNDIKSESFRDSSTSRREVLKKAAIVGGMVWSIPVIESITTPAYAGSAGPCGIYDCSQQNFGLSVCYCPDGSPGLFVQKADGSCTCARRLLLVQDNVQKCPSGTSQGPTINCGFEARHSVCITECGGPPA